MILSAVAIVVGIVVLARSADIFVDGAAELSLRLGLSAVLVGVVIIGFGTSAPELLVSSLAAAQGSADVGVGNIIGSNVANLTLVLGIAGLVATAGVAVSSKTIRREVPLTIGATAMFGWFLQGGLTRVEGGVLLATLAVILAWLALAGRVQPDEFLDEAADAVPDPRGTLRAEVLRTVIGLVGVLIGAQALVSGATHIADSLGLSGGFVGMTVVAVGTSTPEIVTSAKAAAQGHSDLLVGNLLGSTMFNSLAVGGVVALLAPGPVGDKNLTVVGVIAMIAASLLALAFMSSNRLISRVEAALLVAFYVALLPFLS